MMVKASALYLSLWNGGVTSQRFGGNIPWGSARSWDRGLSGSWNCSHPHPTHCHSVPTPSRLGGDRKLQMGFTGRWCLCVGRWKYRDGYEKKKPHWFTSGQSNVTFQISRLKSVASAQHFYFRSGDHLSNCFFLLFHSPFQASKPLLLFSSFIFPVLWNFLPGVSQLPRMRIVEPDILS